MGLLTDIYNTVAKFFRPQDELEGDASKSVATNRLKLVLMQDRTNLTPKILEQMRGEMIDLLSKYLEMDKDMLELNFEQEGDQVALMLSIPVIRAKDEAEIEEAIKSKEEVSDKESNETEDDESEEEFEENADNENIVTEDSAEEENCEVTDTVEESVAVVKPKKNKRKEKVSAPEDLEQNTTDNETDESISETTEPVVE